jgi:hypothetical protein
MFNDLNTLLTQLSRLSDLCSRYPLVQRMVTLLAALLLAALLLGSVALLPGLVQPVRVAAALR